MNEGITICREALWHCNEKLTFAVDIERLAASSSVRSLRSAKQEQLTVQATTLDRFVEERRLTRVDFIKADIEGAERNMLWGAQKTLRKFAPKLSICTYHLPDDPQAVRQAILDADPRYVITEKHEKLFAHIPSENGWAQALR